MGESHYDQDDLPPPELVSSFTSEIVTRWGANAEGYKRFFGNIYATFNEDGAHWSSDEFKNFWNSICFYNYVQSFVRGGAGERPTAQQFSESTDAFHAVRPRPRVVRLSSPIAILLPDWQAFREYFVCRSPPSASPPG